MAQRLEENQKAVIGSPVPSFSSLGSLSPSASESDPVPVPDSGRELVWPHRLLDRN